jgi:hypothetical protein
MSELLVMKQGRITVMLWSLFWRCLVQILEIDTNYPDRFFMVFLSVLKKLPVLSTSVRP